MAPWYDRELPDQHMVMMLSPQGAGIEPCELDAARARTAAASGGTSGRWSSPSASSNLERACDRLGRAGVELLGEPQRSTSARGEWRYAYLVDPDGLYVSLVEPRY